MNNTVKTVLGVILRLGLSFLTIGISLYDMKLADKRRKEAMAMPAKLSDEDKNDIAERVALKLKKPPKEKPVVE